ncbi:precorrin-8X methylmutase [Natranaerovirga pectinivora]|uniref:Precorrin-8X methylmutase n=1 Tax=Natranaerovirga pectinivora TaxID=682400 RepID=A0A4R3MNV7_9FIRM|nr:precorrin-8X methylmutase [Natranaerovirga pectinivora]TCT13799.1 precorrin-8X methylmutase [Natranaerovirga pectinivora]
MYNYIENPQEIERQSFKIIHSEMKNTELEPIKLSIIKRVIHTTTDFDYEDILLFKEKVEETLLNAMKKGCMIVTDTEMIKAGISKPLAKELNITMHSFVGTEEAYHMAKEKGITRSMAAVDIALDLPQDKLFVIGNAPTALYRILEKKQLNNVRGVIGVPVGFVGAKESKEALWESNIPSIISQGRKGGSTVAVAIVNALLREAVKAIEE